MPASGRASDGNRDNGGVNCPCGTALPFEECCGRLHSGAITAPTAVALMRSRYSAFAVGDVTYLMLTWDPSTRPGTVTLDQDQRWQRLEIVDTTGGGLLHTEGTVEFRAHYRQGGRHGVLHERSRFRRDDGRWVYVDGVHS